MSLGRQPGSEMTTQGDRARAPLPGSDITRGIRTAQDGGKHLRQQWLRVGRQYAGAPGDEAVRPHKHCSLSRYTHFCLPAILKIDSVAVGTDPIG